MNMYDVDVEMNMYDERTSKYLEGKQKSVEEMNVEHYSDPNWSKIGFSTMEEIRRMGLFIFQRILKIIIEFFCILR